MESFPAHEIKRSDVRHSCLPDTMVSRIILIRHARYDVMPHSLKEWVDGFQRDANPTQEIEIWESIAGRYTIGVRSIDATREEKFTIFEAMLLASTTDAKSAAEVLLRLAPDRLAKVTDAILLKQSIFSEAVDSSPEIGIGTPAYFVEEFGGDSITIDNEMVKQISDKIFKLIEP